MNILYLGESQPWSSALDRARALRRLGHAVEIVDPAACLPSGRLWRKLHWLTGYRLVCARATRHVLASIDSKSKFDLVWVDGGAQVSRGLLAALRSRSRRLLNYNLDDPTGRRDAPAWGTFRNTIPCYDLCVVVRRENLAEYRAWGARRVMRVFRGYDEVAHAPLALTPAEREQWASPVLFAGTWMPERGPLMWELRRRQVPLAIYGNRWERAPEWAGLKSSWRGPALVGADYVRAIQSSEIALGLVSLGNRDQHTQRSLEIPRIGALLCAQRTPEHAALFIEGQEAVFWDDPIECAQKCLDWLARPREARQAAALAGQRKVQQLGMGNETIQAAILERLLGGKQASRVGGRMIENPSL